MARNRFAIARLIQTTGVLASQLKASREATRMPIFLRRVSFFTLFRNQQLKLTFLLFVGWITTDPCQHLSTLGKHREENLAAKRPATLVAATIERQVANFPLFHRLGREAGVSPHIASSGGRHLRDIAD